MPPPARFAPPAVLVLLLAGASPAAPDDWAEGTADNTGGATREFYNSAAALRWEHPMGDWRDAKDRPQGDAAYAAAAVAAAQKGAFVEWDVTPLVKAWAAGTHRNQGFFLRVTDGKGDFQFASRVAGEADRRPQLVVTGDTGSATLAPQADTYLEGSTVRSVGKGGVLRVSTKPNHALLRFDLAGAKAAGAPAKATLRLFNTAQTSGAKATIGVFRCAQGKAVPETEPVFGLAAKYPGDNGIGKDPRVVFFADFEAKGWADEWSHVRPREALAAVAADPDRKFEPLQGKALRALLAKGKLTALDLTLKLADKAGAEPEEMFFRYYLRLGEDWNQTVSGGKLPGFSGTYGKAGWGGRKAHGDDGWSARGSFGKVITGDNPLAGLQPIGNYVYHADMPGTYGQVWTWTEGYRGYLAKNRWYCIEQHVRLNKVGEKDGLIRAWVDGRPAFEKTGLQFRTVDRLKIEQLWMDVYHGGTVPSPADQHLFIDNVVVAREYIGPMK